LRNWWLIFPIRSYQPFLLNDKIMTAMNKGGTTTRSSLMKQDYTSSGTFFMEEDENDKKIARVQKDRQHCG
jgi:hypothetical protein